MMSKKERKELRALLIDWQPTSYFPEFPEFGIMRILNEDGKVLLTLNLRELAITTEEEGTWPVAK